MNKEITLLSSVSLTDTTNMKTIKAAFIMKADKSIYAVLERECGTFNLDLTNYSLSYKDDEFSTAKILNERYIISGDDADEIFSDSRHICDFDNIDVEKINRLKKSETFSISNSAEELLNNIKRENLIKKESSLNLKEKYRTATAYVRNMMI